MAAMMTRNRFVGWASFVFSLQSWLGQSEQTRRNASMPGYFSAGMACKHTLVTSIVMQEITSYVEIEGWIWLIYAYLV